ncbi:MAG TPA: ribonuclease Z [Ignavibacteriaceae bacterium]|nr:ribonuclease Z [Ignavibacterium sp.]HMN17719.1 ribonuclease Z [Ignavibacteriaceae bacterium]
MNIKFIGTGSGLTSLDRNHSSFLINSSDCKVLVDCGDGISKALLSQSVNFNTINSIIISHLHADHFAGLPSLLTQMKLNSRKEKLSIYIYKSDKEFLTQFIQHSYLFFDRLLFELDIISFAEEEKIFLTDDFYFISKRNSHLDKYRKNKTSAALSYTSLSFLFLDNENSVIYTGDVGTDNDLFLFGDKVDWLITEITHISLAGIISLIEKKIANRIILTHLDRLSDKIILDLKKHFEIDFSNNNILIASDGFELNHYNSNCL